MNVIQLNKNHGIPGTLSFLQWGNGVPLVAVHNQSAQALISLYGGQVLSFKPVHATDDLLFLSRNALMQGKKAIRGGIPVCWPWFGPDPEGLSRPSHGFARTSLWELAQTESSDVCTRIRLRLPHYPNNQALWPHAHELELIITVGNELTLELITRNTGEKPFTISQALHAYFNIGDIEQVEIMGLNDHYYLDKLAQGQQKMQRGTVTVSAEVDRIYTGIDEPLIINDPVLKRQIGVSTDGSETIIVWNPWRENSARMADLNTNGYQQFICVEAGNAEADSQTIAPGSEHRLKNIVELLITHKNP